jgi:hypothetical protein
MDAPSWVPPGDWRRAAWEHRDTVLCGIRPERTEPVALPAAPNPLHEYIELLCRREALYGPWYD